ncbi:MAG: head decoration protein [Deltaproteobacteria bacterium]|nr:head decoration protein [Deltaproteobacteria bacterium]
MTELNQPNTLQDILKWEQENRYSREIVTVNTGENLSLGAVIGKILKSIPTTGTLGSGTNGECTGVTGGLKTQIGTYKATCTTANGESQDGVWRIEAPDGTVLGDLVVTQGTSGTGTFADPQINLTISYATGYNSEGDYFTIEVAEGSGKAVEIDFSAVDGSQNAHGFLIDAVDAASDDVDGVAIVRDALIVPDDLVWPDGATSDQKAAALAELADKGILTRTEA